MKQKSILTVIALLLAMGSAWAQTEVTPTGNVNEWQMTMPAGNVLLTVNYLGEYTLDSIPMDWQVKVGDAQPVYPTAYTEGNTSLGHLTITETDSVELIPPADVKPIVKNVTLTEVVPPQPQTLIVYKGTTGLSGDKELYYMPGDTYRQALARPENQSGNGLGWGFWESQDLTTIFFKEVSNTAWDVTIDSDFNFTPGIGTCAITLDSVIDPNHAFQFIAEQQ